MKIKTSEKRQNKRYQFEESPLIFCKTIVGKIEDVSVGGIKMAHTGRQIKPLGTICKIDVLGKDYAMQLQARLTGSTKINNLMSVCRFKYVSLTEEKKSKLKQVISQNAVTN
jgi:hypothetical protein